MNTKSMWEQRRKRLAGIVEIGSSDGSVSRGYDVLGTLVIIINLIVSVLMTFTSVEQQYGKILLLIERITVIFFSIDYVLRLWTAKYIFDADTEYGAMRKYMLSFSGIVDLLSFLPYFLPIFFPSGAVAFRIFRIIRIFRLFRINAYYDSLYVITEVIVGKRQQLMSSVFIILILMLASSLCMYSLENKAQPDVFQNAFSGIWWSVSTLLTVGYGDIYPITFLGKVFGIFISFLGVGIVAIPTGIISAGFVEQYNRIKQISEYAKESNVRFIKVQLQDIDAWANKSIKNLGLPHGILVVVIQRMGEILVPRGETILRPGDMLVLAAESFAGESRIELKEIEIKQQNDWAGELIRDLDISRRSVIVMVERGEQVMIPNGNLRIQVGDKIMMYTQKRMRDADSIRI
ncbi:MAG TPA: ion transporter [Candidatus Fimousia stercorigallinarum]|nr:ion transporter [Candidatus Fimousia stercorigallinarum]